jgi:hypothetical protein
MSTIGPADRREVSMSSIQVGSAGLVLQYVMIVNRFLDEIAVANPRVDGRGCSVGPQKQRLAVDLTNDAPSHLDLSSTVSDTRVGRPLLSRPSVLQV